MMYSAAQNEVYSYIVFVTDVCNLHEPRETIPQRHIEWQLLSKSTMYGERFVFKIVADAVNDVGVPGSAWVLGAGAADGDLDCDIDVAHGEGMETCISEERSLSRVVDP
jgi:hypothetical protein